MNNFLNNLKTKDLPDNELEEILAIYNVKKISILAQIMKSYISELTYKELITISIKIMSKDASTTEEEFYNKTMLKIFLNKDFELEYNSKLKLLEDEIIEKIDKLSI